jgi:Lamin Tail Domain
VNPNSLIVINEIMYDPDVPNDVDGEWFELYNRGTTDTVNLAGWTFKDPVSPAQTFTVNANLLIGPGQYRVLGQSTDTAVNGNVTVDYAYGNNTFFLSNSVDTIIMTDSSGVQRARITYGTATGFVDPVGASISLKSPELTMSAGTNWCPSNTVWPGSTFTDRGTPGAANVCA